MYDTLQNDDRFKKDELASIIQDMILSGAFISGERLPSERNLAMQFGVSRPTIHEALLQLQGKGFILMRPRHGCIVNDFSTPTSISLMTELYLNNRITDPHEMETGLVEFRYMILSEVIRKLILKTEKFSKKENDEFFQPLENLIEFSKTDDIDEISREDFEFYKTLIKLTNNLIFSLVFEVSREIYIHQFRKFLNENFTSIKTIPKYKRAFVNELKLGNQKETIEMMFILTTPKTYRLKNDHTDTSIKYKNIF